MRDRETVQAIRLPPGSSHGPVAGDCRVASTASDQPSGSLESTRMDRRGSCRVRRRGRCRGAVGAMIRAMDEAMEMTEKDEEGEGRESWRASKEMGQKTEGGWRKNLQGVNRCSCAVLGAVASGA